MNTVATWIVSLILAGTAVSGLDLGRKDVTPMEEPLAGGKIGRLAHPESWHDQSDVEDTRCESDPVTLECPHISALDDEERMP